jgi:pimeloyl-ACP methyl ester carboxylesterase
MERYGLPGEVGFRTGKRGLLKGRPTLVLIHGAGGSAQNFLPQLRFLDRNLNVLALELPGHGGSKGPGKQTIAEYARWVHETLKGPYFESFFLGGHSMGGAVSLETGRRYPENISGLILMATGAKMEVSPQILRGLAEDPHETIIKINRWCYPKGTSPHLIELAARLMEQTPASTILKDFEACHRFNRLEEIRQIRRPALILVGDQDVMTPPDYSRYLSEQISSSSLTIIPGAGHMVMLDKPRETNQAVWDFIAARSSAGR